MQVTLPIRQISYCELPGMDKESQICAGDTNKDSCSVIFRFRIYKLLCIAIIIQIVIIRVIAVVL